DLSLGWAVHGAYNLAGTICDGDLDRGLVLLVLLRSGLDFRGQRISNDCAAGRIGRNKTASGETMLVPVVPVHGGQGAEEMEIAPSQLHAAFLKRRDVIQHVEAAAMSGHHQVVSFFHELDVINRR